MIGFFTGEEGGGTGANASEGLSPGVATLLTIIIIVVMAALIVFLYFSVRRERKRYAASKSGSETGVAVDEFKEIIKQRCRKEGAVFSVWRLLVSDYKNLIDSYGQTQYDRAFKELLARLKKALPSSTRYSSEEGGVLNMIIISKQTEESFKQLATSIILECNNGIRLSENMTMIFDVNLAIVEHNESNKTPELIESNLEYTMAQSQRKGLNQFSLHAPDITDTSSEEYKTYIEIKSAIENKEFTLYYQQINDIITGDTAGYESLLRWNHRTMGVLPPSTFLNILDTSGDINWVGIWAFEQILRQHGIWGKYYPDRKFFISMNLSAKQLMSDKLVPELRHVLKKYKVQANDVCMEIAEYAFLQSGIIADNIEKLSQAGFLIAVDNYGMEMNITALDKYKIDIIKIERQFVLKALGINDEEEETTSKELLKLVISYASRRSIKLVAEGIEDEPMMTTIRDLGVRYGQGYYFSKPVAAEEIKFIE